MKLFTIVALLSISALASAGYDYVISDGYFGSMTLMGNQSLLMTGGGGDTLSLRDTSYAEILNTTPYDPYIGGLRLLSMAGNSSIMITGGQIHQFDVNSESTAQLRGGLIGEIRSYQFVPLINQQKDQHIEMFVKNYQFDALMKVLTGTWEDDNTFKINLLDQPGYTPVIDNIHFTIIPEPMTLTMIGLGGMLIRRRK